MTRLKKESWGRTYCRKDGGHVERRFVNY